jgi:hypothetical protein
MSTGSGMAANTRATGTPTARTNPQFPSTATAIAKQNQSAPKTATPAAVADATPTAQTKPITPPSPPATPTSPGPPTPVPVTDPQPNPAASLTPNNSSLKSLTAGTPVADGVKPAAATSTETSARVSLPVPTDDLVPVNTPPVPATAGPMAVPTPAATTAAEVAVPPVSLASSPPPFPAPTKVRQ